MTTDNLDIRSLEELLERHTGSSGHDGSGEDAEHPLAKELRTILASPGAHRVGDLAKVVDDILREMSMLAPAAATHEADDDQQADELA